MKRRSVVTFLPRRTSITSSVGTRTSSISSSRPFSTTSERILFGDLLLEVREDTDRIPPLRHKPCRLASGRRPLIWFVFLRCAGRKNGRATRIIARRQPEQSGVLELGCRLASPGALSDERRAAVAGPVRMIQSTKKKKIAVSVAMISTMTVVNSTSRRVGQVILATSARVCWMNWSGLVFVRHDDPRSCNRVHVRPAPARIKSKDSRTPSAGRRVRIGRSD